MLLNESIELLIDSKIDKVFCINEFEEDLSFFDKFSYSFFSISKSNFSVKVEKLKNINKDLILDKKDNLKLSEVEPEENLFIKLKPSVLIKGDVSWD